jgi:hypothetical protein
VRGARASECPLSCDDDGVVGRLLFDNRIGVATDGHGGPEGLAAGVVAGARRPPT